MKNKILKIVLVILLMIACGFGGWFLGAKVFDVEDKALNKKDNVKEKVENTGEEKSNDTTSNISIGDLYGTYNWSKNIDSIVAGSNGPETITTKLNIELTLNQDGTATYSASNGQESEKTKGSFKYEDNKIIYTREYYNYQGTNGTNVDEPYNDENSKTEVFTVIDKNTLQNTYYDQLTELKK